MTDDFRFPTLDPGMSFHGENLPGPPIYPNPGIYETTVVKVGNEVITPARVEQIIARPKWNFEEANLRLFKEKKARETAAAKAKAADRTKKTPTPKRTPKRPR